jgi:hypothetical protein
VIFVSKSLIIVRRATGGTGPSTTVTSFLTLRDPAQLVRVPERSLVEPLGEARRSRRVVQSVDRSSHHNQKKKQKQKQNENE